MYKNIAKREIRPIGPEHIEDYLTIYLNAYPAFKDIGQEGRALYRERNLTAMTEYDHVHYVGLFEDETLIAIMKLIDFSMNLFGEMRPATGLMSLAVHPLHKKKGAALEMVRHFEAYTRQSGGLVSLLLPFRMDFYRQMGYGYGTKLDEYHIPTRQLPECRDMSHVRLLEPSDLPLILACHSAAARRNHGMLEKFEEEVRDMAEDTAVRRVGAFADDGHLRGYVCYELRSDNDVNYTLNHMVVTEMVYEDGDVLKTLLGYLRLQADLAETVLLRTGERDFYHILDSAQDVSGNYIPFGFLQTNVSAVGNMYKIADLERFVKETSHRDFPALELTVRFICEDAMEHQEKVCTLAFRREEKGGAQCHQRGVSRWETASPEAAADVTVHCTMADLSSLLLGCCQLSSLVRLGGAKISDLSLLPQLDLLLYCPQQPFTNTDY